MNIHVLCIYFQVVIYDGKFWNTFKVYQTPLKIVVHVKLLINKKKAYKHVAHLLIAMLFVDSILG